MWDQGWRERVWAELPRPWDLVVIGGGITGAGILREAARAGLRALLLDAGDFGYGTSSRSSKLVHGGLRYLKQGEVRLTLQAVHERERLLREGRGLVTQLGFLLPGYTGDRPPGWVFGLGLSVYDLLALHWAHRHYDALDMQDLCPPLREAGLRGGYRYFDAQTDDARLVLRVIREAVRGGGVALNYAPVEGLLIGRDGQVRGLGVRDAADPGGRTVEAEAAVVINATGAWANSVRDLAGVRARADRRLRQLRGSHLVLPAGRLPLRRAVSFLHPADRRPVFAVPWEGVTLFGTTDVDHGPSLAEEPAATAGEVAYLLDGLRYAFECLDLSEADVQATFAGVRPVVDTGKADPSKESREHVLWRERGLLTVTGGKLTTFRLMAREALHAARERLPGRPRFAAQRPMLDPLSPDALEAGALSPTARLRLAGRHGAAAAPLIAAAQLGELEAVERTPVLWAELRWAARDEGVVHLDDLLLRRTRLGLLLTRGGLHCLDRIRTIVQPELGWSDARWAAESADYERRWRQGYAWPPSAAGPT